jgi:hypothetical protein
MMVSTPIVEGWLNIATEKLPPATKARIGLEIDAHFEEARERHRAEGLDEAEALLHALKDLGDPDAASRRFRCEYLTEKDIAVLRSELHPAVFLSRGIASSAGILIVSFLELVPAHFRVGGSTIALRGGGFMVAVFCLGLSLLLCLTKIRQKPGVNAIAVLLISLLMSCALAGTAYAIVGGSGSAAPIFMGMTPLFFYYFFITLNRLRLLLKLWRIRDAWQEMPPLVKN